MGMIRMVSGSLAVTSGRDEVDTPVVLLAAAKMLSAPVMEDNKSAFGKNMVLIF
jgi:hypothetical protein